MVSRDYEIYPKPGNPTAGIREDYRLARLLTDKPFRCLPGLSRAPLYRKFYARHITPNPPVAELRAFAWRDDVLNTIRPRAPRTCIRKPDFAIYADASILIEKIASVAVSSKDGGGDLDRFTRRIFRSGSLDKPLSTP